MLALDKSHWSRKCYSKNMKKIGRRILFTGVGLAILSYWFSGISYGNSLKTLLISSVVFVSIDWLLKPLIKVVLLPINLMTFGLLGWLVGVAVLWLTVMLVEGLTITTFGIGPVNFYFLIIPRIVVSGFWSIVVAAVGLKLIKRVLFTIA